MKNRLLPLIFAFLAVTSVNAQKCGTYVGSYEEQEKKYPAFYKNLESVNADLEANYKSALSKMTHLKTENGKKIIPVVVHVIHDSGSENISDASIQGALNILNANINGQASNFLTKTPDIFASVRGDLNVEFRLAKIDPIGNPTSGIIRVRSELTNEPEPRDAVKALSYWNSYEYFNIWTLKKFLPQEDGNILLGYAQFPWQESDDFPPSMSTDGVVLLSSQMASGGTLTHEVGHWLGLRHVWGDAICGDDNVKDTPTAKDPNFGVNLSDFPYHVGLVNPSTGVVPWGCVADSINPAGEMFVNYMDYSSDADVTMFTIGQNEVMNGFLDGLYDEETGISSIGYRQYLCSDENVISTGTNDGYFNLEDRCGTNYDFREMSDLLSVCLGTEVWFKSNSKALDLDITSVFWDLGDANSAVLSDTLFIPGIGHSKKHTYEAPGKYTVTLFVDYNVSREVRVSNLDDLLEGYDELEEILDTTFLIQGTESELVAAGASNVTVHIDTSGYSKNSYWVRNQETTDSMLLAYKIDTLYYDSIMNVSVYVDSTFLSSTQEMLLDLADSSWVEDVLQGTIDTFEISYAQFNDTTIISYLTYEDSTFLSSSDSIAIFVDADSSWSAFNDFEIDSLSIYYGEYYDTTIISFITYIDSTSLLPSDSVILFSESDTSWTIDGVLNNFDSVRVHFAQFNHDSILEILSISFSDDLTASDSLLLSTADSSWNVLDIIISDSIRVYYAQFNNDSLVEFSNIINSILNESDSLVFNNADSTWNSLNIVGHFDTVLTYYLQFFDSTVISYLTYIDSTSLLPSDSVILFTDADTSWSVDGLLNNSDSVRIYYAQFNHDSTIQISTYIETGLSSTDSLLLNSADTSWYLSHLIGQVDTLRTYFGYYSYSRYDGYFADTLFYRGNLERTIYIAHYQASCNDTIIKVDYITIGKEQATNIAFPYAYSFEGENELNTDWVLAQPQVISNQWDFHSSINTVWEWTNKASNSGNASIMIDRDNMKIGSTEIISPAYDLSDLSDPAIKFSWSGAASSTTVVNELKALYSSNCGRSWFPLGTIDAINSANAGMYLSDFAPNASEWMDTVMTKNQLKNDNIMFKFEYIVNGNSNNFYLDNIMIGEESDLMIIENTSSARVSVYPNPTDGKAFIELNNLAYKEVVVKLVNILGAEIIHLFSGEIESNYYKINNIDLSHLETGIYFVKVVADGDIIMTDKLILK